MEQAEGTQDQNIVTNAIAPQNVQDAPAEKVLRQSEVNELVGRVRQEAYSRGLREGAAQQPQTEQPQADFGSGLGGMPQVTEDQVRQLIADEAQKQAQETMARQTVNSFVQQMNSGKEKYSDFDEVIANLGDLRNIPHIVELATKTGVARDVMYDLARNPEKVALLTTLAYINPHLANKKMESIVNSIKMNEQASSAPSANEPLSHVKPSTTGTDNGSRSVSDLRRKYRA